MAAAIQLSSATAIYPCPPFGIYRLPHSTSCGRYVQCFAGVAVERNCGTGLQYNAKMEKCMDATLADCSRNQCPLFNDPANLVYLADYLDCGKYYLCHDNEAKPFQCAEGLHWDEKNEYCTTPVEAECVDYEIYCRPNEVHNLPNPRFCNQFYYCLNGESFPTACPEGLLFDTILNRCHYAGTARCYEESFSP